MIINQNLNKWLASGERGISSEAIVSQLTGINILENVWLGMDYPRDPSDFGRCLKLFIAVPEFRLRLDEMKSRHSIWAKYVENWIEMERLYWKEFPTGKAPKLYDWMQNIQNGFREHSIIPPKT